MDITYPPETERFRAEVKTFLAAHLPPGWTGIGALDEDDAWAFARAWRGRLAEHGYLSVTWPERDGGLGPSQLHPVGLVEGVPPPGGPWGRPPHPFGGKKPAAPPLPRGDPG